MPQHVAVCALLSCVTQPHLTLGAVPRGEYTAFATAVTPGAACTPVLRLLGGIALGNGGRKMSERERTHNSSTTASSFPAAVVSYELTCQLESKLLDRAERCVITVALLKNEGVCNGHVKQKMKYVFVKFSAFRSAAVVAPNLVSSVDTAHEGVVVHDGHGAGNRYP